MDETPAILPAPEQIIVPVPEPTPVASKSSPRHPPQKRKKPKSLRKRTSRTASQSQTRKNLRRPAIKKSLVGTPVVEEAPIVAPQAEVFPELEVTQPHEDPVETDESRPSGWARLFTGLGIRVSKPRQPDVREEAQADVPTEVEESNSPQIEVSFPAEPVRIRSSDEMFAELGAQLLERREALNLTREEIERHIHLRSHYLQALEQGDFGGLPSAVQTRGMLNNYAAFLDLDVDGLLLGFADVLQVRHREQHPLPPGARGRPAPNAPATLPPLRSFMVADLVAIGLVLLIAVFSIWGVQQVIQKGAEAEATPPALLDVLLEPSAAAAVGTPMPTSELLDLGNVTATLEAFETPIGLPAIPEGVNVQINVIALERTFLRVIADGEVVFDGQRHSGDGVSIRSGHADRNSGRQWRGPARDV